MTAALDLRTRMEDVTADVLVRHDDGSLALLTVEPADTGVRVQRTADGASGPSRATVVPADAVLGDVLVSLHRAHPVAAHQLPPGTPASEPWSPRLAVGVGLGALGLLLSLGIVLGAGLGLGATDNWSWSLLAVGALVGPIASLFLGGPFTRYVVDGKPRTLRSFAKQADRGRLPPPEPRAVSPEVVAEVDALKEEYGRLLADIVYRIECPALFDAAEPRTATFTQLLWRWDSDRDVLPGIEARALASELRVAFDAARANAESVGMDHLPAEAREPARTAVGALRVARDDAATRAERATALRRATAILDQLALYYLPSVDDTERIVAGKRPLALPGRRRDDGEDD